MIEIEVPQFEIPFLNECNIAKRGEKIPFNKNDVVVNHRINGLKIVKTNENNEVTE